MRRDFIENIHCPFSGSSFNLTNVFEEDEAEIKYGILSSEAGDFPIIDGILRLQVDELWKPIVECLKKRMPHKALQIALEIPFHSKTGSAINFLSRTMYRLGHDSVAQGLGIFKRGMYQVFADRNATFIETIRSFGSNVRLDWQLYRFSMTTFFPVYPLLHLIKDDAKILDFGCGTGQGSFLIARMSKNSRITCADISFTVLYLSRKFFLKNADFVCIDGDYLLPFNSKYFSNVFSTDAFHFIDSKLSLSQEFRRVLADGGAIILPHLHNKLSPVKSGKSLTPHGYSELFKGMKCRIVPEESIVHQYLREGVLDLDKIWSENDLSVAFSGLSLVASNDGAIFRRYERLWERYIDCMTNPVLNPIYRVSRENGTWLLEKQVHEICARAVELRGDQHLPDRLVLDVSALDPVALSKLKSADTARFSELVRKFVLIDVPQHFA